jgi:hypothetical protein
MPARVLHALNLLLESGAPRVIVRKNGAPIGYLDLGAVQAASVPRVQRSGVNDNEPRSFVPQDDTGSDDTGGDDAIQGDTTAGRRGGAAP